MHEAMAVVALVVVSLFIGEAALKRQHSKEQ